MVAEPYWEGHRAGLRDLQNGARELQICCTVWALHGEWFAVSLADVSLAKLC